MIQPRPSRPSTVRSFVVALLLVALPASAAAQELFVDAVDVNIVNVEVVVTDEDGNPVTDLGPEDFTVYEDGEPVEITNFYAVDRRPSEAVPAAGEAASAPAPPAMPLPQDGTRQLHLVLLVDQDGLEPHNRAELFAGLRADIDRAFALDGQVMVATLHDGVDIVVPFTDDRDRVVAALDELATVASTEGIDVPQRTLISEIDRAPTAATTNLGGTFNTSFDSDLDNAMRLAASVRHYAEREVALVRQSVGETARLVDTLAGLPGRKALLLLSEGLARRPAEFLVEVWREKFAEWMDSYTGQLGHTTLLEKERFLQLASSTEFDTSREVAELMRLAAARRVAFYPISPRGRNAFAGTSRLSGAGGLAQRESIDKQESLLQLADGTGGVAWTNTSNIGGLIDRVAQDFEHFYSLGYEPPRPDDDAYHKVKVEVSRPGVELRYVDGYRPQDPAERLRDLTLAALHFGAEENPLGVSLATTATEPAGKKTSLVTLEVTIPYDRMLLIPAQDSHKARLKLVVIVRDEATGGTSKPHEIDLPVSIPNHLLLEALAKNAVYPMQLQIEEGAKQIAVGIRDELSRIDSTTRLGVVVPAAG